MICGDHGINRKKKLYSEKTVEYMLDDVPEQITRIAMRLLNQLGFPPHLKGYSYWLYALQIAYRDPEVLRRLTKELYPRIAEHFQVSTFSVESNLRTALNMAWERGRPEQVSLLLGRSVNLIYERPTCGEMLALMTAKLHTTLNRVRYVDQLSRASARSRHRRSK